MLSPETLKKVEAVFIRSRHKVTDVFAGEYRSAFRGRGLEFEEFREYVPGDDIRGIDWNVTARMDRPFVKIFREEREQTIFFIVDVSKSLDFGRAKTKREVATEIAALLAYAAIKGNDKIGLILFSDHIERFIPPKKGRAHVWNLIATLLSHESKGKKTDIKSALQFFLQVAHHKTTCFLVSDFFDDQYQKALNVAKIRHEFIIIRILDQLEKSLPKGALMDFEDLEDGVRVSADFGSAALRKQFDHLQKKKQQTLIHYLRGHKVDFLDLSVDEDYVEALLRFFIWREKKR